MRRPILKASALLSLLTTVASFSSLNTQRKSRPYPGVYREASVPRREDVLAEVASSPAPSSVMNEGSSTSPSQAGNDDSDNNRSNAILWPNKNYPRRRKVLRPPMVDSTLLRFLGKQKRLQNEQGQVTLDDIMQDTDDTGSVSASVNDSNGDVDPEPQSQTLPLSSSSPPLPLSPTNGYLTSLSQEDDRIVTTAASDLPLSTMAASPTLTLTQQQEQDLQPPLQISQQLQREQEQQQLEQQQQQLQSEQVDSSLGQFNRYRIASMLRATLARDSSSTNLLTAEDEMLFGLAGERVQSQALARTARRRVREFLKERDQAWTTAEEDTASSPSISSSSGSQTGTTTPTLPSERTAAMTTPSASPPPYGVQDVVDVMLSYGLTAKDIAEIFVHSPGIALMRPRPQQAAVQHQQQQGEESESETDLDASMSAGEAELDASMSAESTAAVVEPKQESEGEDNGILSNNNNNGETLQETLDRSLVGLLCGTLKLRKYDARKVLRNCPGLLTMRGSRQAEQVIQLLSKLGVSANSIARDKNSLPTLLSRSPAALFRLIAFLSSDAVRMPMNKIGPLLRRSECQVLLDMVAPVPVFDSSTDTTGSDDGDDDHHVEHSKYNDGTTDPGVVAALWGRSSQVRRERINQVYRNMTTTASTLRHEIGTEDLGKVISAYPSVLLLDAEEQILPTAHYLMNELGVWEDDLPRVLTLYPALLGMKVSQMEQVSAYLLDLEVAPETLSSIFRSFPALLTLDIEKTMVPVVEFLKSTTAISNVGRFISRLPPILGYSVPNELQPKWEFLESVVTDARFELSRFPAYFSYPLERVIKTRFEYLRNVKRVPVQLMGLDQVMRFGDKDFAVKVAMDKDKGAAFRQFTQDRKQAPAAGGGGDGGRKKPTKQRAPPKKKQGPLQTNNNNKVS